MKKITTEKSQLFDRLNRILAWLFLLLSYSVYISIRANSIMETLWPYPFIRFIKDYLGMLACIVSVIIIGIRLYMGIILNELEIWNNFRFATVMTREQINGYKKAIYVAIGCIIITEVLLMILHSNTIYNATL